MKFQIPYATRVLSIATGSSVTTYDAGGTSSSNDLRDRVCGRIFVADDEKDAAEVYGSTVSTCSMVLRINYPWVGESIFCHCCLSCRGMISMKNLFFQGWTFFSPRPKGGQLSSRGRRPRLDRPTGGQGKKESPTKEKEVHQRFQFPLQQPIIMS